MNLSVQPEITQSRARQPLSAHEMKLPPSPTPRYGELVSWYAGPKVLDGIFLGMSSDGQPVLTYASGNNQTGHSRTSCRSLTLIRRSDPFTVQDPAWHGLPSGAICRPLDSEATALKAALSHMVPPGVIPLHLISEFWKRGYETFVVGGSVRDAIGGMTPHDVDLITTMPMHLVRAILASITGKPVRPNNKTGFVRLGEPDDGDSNFIDIKLFAPEDLNPEDIVFGGDFLSDTRARDFAANSVYYDPENNALIDPSRQGIIDSEAKTLNLVHDHIQSLPKKRARIFVRCCKFKARGFVVTPSTAVSLKQHYSTDIGALTSLEIRDYVFAQIVNKTHRSDKDAVWAAFKASVVELSSQEIWTKHFDRLTEEVLG